MTGSKSLKLLLFALVFAVSHVVSATTNPALAADEKIILWSWFNADDTCQSQPDNLDCAYALAILRGRVIAGDTIARIVTVPRMAAVKHNHCLRDMAVVRLEILPDRLDLNSTELDLYIERLVQSTLSLALGSRPIQCLQIDCDARLTQRDLYARYLQTLRKRLPPQIELSITALASWAFGDRWIAKANLPVDEVVPMYFSMGKTGSEIKHLFVAGKKPDDFGLGKRVAGLRLQELTDFLATIEHTSLKFDRIYLFSSNGWSPQNSREAIKLVLPLLSRKKPQ